MNDDNDAFFLIIMLLIQVILTVGLIAFVYMMGTLSVRAPLYR